MTDQGEQSRQRLAQQRQQTEHSQDGEDIPEFLERWLYASSPLEFSSMAVTDVLSELATAITKRAREKSGRALKIALGA